MRRPLIITVVAAALASCSDGPSSPRDDYSPRLVTAAAADNPHNVLSSIVSLETLSTDSARVRIRVAGEAQVTDSTPAFTLDDATATIPVLGLRGGTDYEFVPVLYGAGGTTIGDAVAWTSGPLPGDVPSYVASGMDPSPGFVFFAAGEHLVAIDDDGRIAWYRRFDDGVGLNAMAQATGTYVAKPPTPDTDDDEPWVEIDPLGNIVRELRCADGLRARQHDIELVVDGSYWILCDQVETMDLTAHGGVANATVTGTVVQHVGADGTLLFSWSAFDHFEITDVPLAERTGEQVNWTHGNGIDVSGDGDIVVSFRNLNEITKIDGQTGDVLWRLGGLRNQFTFEGGDEAGFTGQHSVRLREPGVIVLLDNLGIATESRAEDYEIDETAMTATLLRSYASHPPVVTRLGGSVQPLDGGRTLVSFGQLGRVEEYDAGGTMVWQIEGNPGYVFRAQRIASLYAPGVGTSR